MRRWWLVLLAAFTSACGGGASTSPSASPLPAPTPAAGSAVALDASTFSGRVAAGVCVVEFHSPT